MCVYMSQGLTDAVVTEITGQTLLLVFRVVLSLPGLELLTREAGVLGLPLWGIEGHRETWRQRA